MTDCPKCRHSNAPEAAFCVKCGAKLPSQEREEKRTSETLVPPLGMPSAIPLVPPAQVPPAAAGAPRAACKACGAEIPAGCAFCGRCGEKAGS